MIKEFSNNISVTINSSCRVAHILAAEPHHSRSMSQNFTANIYLREAVNGPHQAGRHMIRTESAHTLFPPAAQNFSKYQHFSAVKCGKFAENVDIRSRSLGVNVEI